MNNDKFYELRENKVRQSIAVQKSNRNYVVEDTLSNSNKNTDLLEFCHRHISKLVAIKLIENKLDVNKWHATVFKLVRKIVQKVRPSSRLLNDSININAYVKIKIVEHSDSSLTGYSNGIVMSSKI